MVSLVYCWGLSWRERVGFSSPFVLGCISCTKTKICQWHRTSADLSSTLSNTLLYPLEYTMFSPFYAFKEYFHLLWCCKKQEWIKHFLYNVVQILDLTTINLTIYKLLKRKTHFVTCLTLWSKYPMENSQTQDLFILLQIWTVMIYLQHILMTFLLLCKMWLEKEICVRTHAYTCA
jgi:hypothetical protein